MKNSQKQDSVNPPFLFTDTINGIKFTPRELDVLACILEGRSAKKIASGNIKEGRKFVGT